MSRKRGPYRRRVAEPSGLLSKLVFGASANPEQPMAQAKRDRLMATMWSALEGITRGRHPGEDEWRHLSDAVNVIETLWLRGNLVRAEVEPTWDAACQALARAGRRWHDQRVMRMDAEGLTAVRACVDHYQQALMGLPERDFLMAIFDTRERLACIANGLRPTDREVMYV